MLLQEIFWLLVFVRARMAFGRVRVVSGTRVQPARNWLVFFPDGLLNLVFGLRVFLSFLGCTVCFIILSLGFPSQIIGFRLIFRSKAMGDTHQPVGNIYALAPDSFHEIDQGFGLVIGFWMDLGSWEVF